VLPRPRPAHACPGHACLRVASGQRHAGAASPLAPRYSSLPGVSHAMLRNKQLPLVLALLCAFVFGYLTASARRRTAASGFSGPAAFLEGPLATGNHAKVRRDAELVRTQHAAPALASQTGTATATHVSALATEQSLAATARTPHHSLSLCCASPPVLTASLVAGPRATHPAPSPGIPADCVGRAQARHVAGVDAALAGARQVCEGAWPPSRHPC